jgi:hypothetical protein
MPADYRILLVLWMSGRMVGGRDAVADEPGRRVYPGEALELTASSSHIHRSRPETGGGMPALSRAGPGSPPAPVCPTGGKRSWEVLSPEDQATMVGLLGEAESAERSRPAPTQLTVRCVVGRQVLFLGGQAWCRRAQDRGHRTRIGFGRCSLNCAEPDHLPAFASLLGAAAIDR